MVPGQMGIVLADHADGLAKAVTGPDAAAAKRAFDAMLQMKKIDVAKIEAAVRGWGVV
jgi:predicted 3-demethylubiquinone-9 3-methyltransferase (glyoxalase superfamily)